jgi:GNAT superfamily N-acetyltransferase
VLLRPRRDEDLPAVVEVLRAVHAADDYPSRWPDDPAGWLRPPGLRGAWVAVADDDGSPVVVGHVGLLAPARLPEGPPATGPGTAEVVRLVVDPARRRAGVGALLLDEAAAAARAEGLDVDLQVVAGSGAVDVYARLGWTETRRHTASWVDADGSSPEVVRMAPPGRAAAGAAR